MDALKGLPREQKLFIAGGGMVLFIVSLFLTWFEPGISAKDVFDSWWLALVLALIAAAIALAQALNVEIPFPQANTPMALGAAFLVLFWAVTHFIDGEGYKVGAWLGLIASIVGVVGAWLAYADDRR